MFCHHVSAVENETCRWTKFFASFGMSSPLMCCTSGLFHVWCNGVNTAPKYGLLGLMPRCRSWLRTVCELILRNPGSSAAVVYAATVRCRRWKTRMYRSCPWVVMRGLPLLWWPFVEPVCWNLFHILEMVLWLSFRVRATSCWDSPAWRRPIAIFRVAGSILGMTAYQLSNRSQASNLVLLYALV